ncbi:MAG: LysM peptidoglycan-binding domain-containing protein [Lachnospiraceae bacterium]|nr:LysM peptidoglycan-binding domain-containing protein [Lachnospiraceae bacterium]MDD6618048.1 LysM peptidoglycan-binding domain-containing protein [Clostridiales bacterium]
MIEVIYKDEKKKPVGNESFFQIPRNIRQIGDVDDHFKIYIEDYAFHYLDRSADEISDGKIALLLGRSNWAEGVTYVFIKSAFCLTGIEVDANHIPFDETVFLQADEVMKQYFSQQEIVGWFFTAPEYSMEITDAMVRAHLNYFGGNDKVFFMMEPIDGEEAFFRYDNGKMCRQRGYYLYYERNDAMQEYMIEVNHNMPMEKKESVSDQAVKDFRKIISNQDKEEKKQLPYFMYASVAAAVLLILAFGTGYLKDYQTIKEAGENVLETVSLLPASESSLSATPTPSKTAEPMSSETPLPSEKEKTESVVTETPIPAAKKETTPIPSVTPTPLESPQMTETPAAAQTRTYTIRPGDTLTSISQSVYGNADQVNAICRLNNISKETIIYPGEKILLP